MIRFFLKERIAEKEFREKRRITVEEIAEQTGISRTTLSRLMHKHGYSTSTDNLEKLCVYFDCRVGDLVEFLPD